MKDYYAWKSDRRLHPVPGLSELKGMEALWEQGGFFRQLFEDALIKAYGKVIALAALKYCGGDPCLWDVLEVAAAGHEDALGCEYYYIKRKVNNREGSSDEQDDWEEFINWYIEQTARLAYDMIQNGKTSFWKERELPSDVKYTLRYFSILDERILFLKEGLDGSTAFSVDQIARLPEFSCSEKFIARIASAVTEYVEGTLSGGMERLKKVCSGLEQERSPDGPAKI